jgi:hypothetical protein
MCVFRYQTARTLVADGTISNQKTATFVNSWRRLQTCSPGARPRHLPRPLSHRSGVWPPHPWARAQSLDAAQDQARLCRVHGDAESGKEAVAEKAGFSGEERRVMQSDLHSGETFRAEDDLRFDRAV